MRLGTADMAEVRASIGLAAISAASSPDSPTALMPLLDERRDEPLVRAPRERHANELDVLRRRDAAPADEASTSPPSAAAAR